MSCCKLNVRKTYQKLEPETQSGNFPKFLYYLSYEREQQQEFPVLKIKQKIN